MTEVSAKTAPPSSSEFAAGAEISSDRHAANMVLLLGGLFVVFLWAFVAFWVLTSRQESLDHAEQVLSRMNHAVEEQTRRQFKLIEVLFDNVDQWVAENPKANPATDSRFLRLVENFRARTGASIDVSLGTADGGLLSVAAGAADISLAGDRSVLRAALAGASNTLVVGAPVAEPDTGVWRIPVARRLQAPGRAAVVVAAIRLPDLLSMFEEERLRPNGAIVLLRQDGVVLARAPHDERLMGKSLAEGQLFREFLSKRERDVVRLKRTATDAMDKLASYSLLRDYPLVLVVSGSVDDVLALWWRHTQIIVLLALGVMLASIIGTVRLVRVLRELSKRTAELHHLATTDLMTGVSNRHHFLTQLYHEFARTRRYRNPLSLFVLDLDFFKQINDGYGHAAGDAALKAFAVAAGECLRGLDVIGRLGGEEFGILLPNTEVAQAEIVAERIRTAVAHIAIDTEFGTVRFTASIGVTQSVEGDTNVDALLARADAALYEAKAAGRNRVAIRRA